MFNFVIEHLFCSVKMLRIVKILLVIVKIYKVINKNLLILHLANNKLTNTKLCMHVFSE